MSIPNAVDYKTTEDENEDENDFPTNPDTINYNYNTATYNEPRPIKSDYTKTNYDITNFPKTDYTKFNVNLTNFNLVKTTIYNKNPTTVVCDSPDMLYEVPRDSQYNYPDRYMCFNTQNKMVEIVKNNDSWLEFDLSNSPQHIKWQGAQCKITTDMCTNNKLTEDCEATCYVSSNQAFELKYKNNIWRRPDLEEKAGVCSMTAISEDTAQDSFCKCDNVLGRSNLMSKPNMDEARTGKFWCSDK